MKTNTTKLVQTRIPAAVAKTVKAKAKAAGMTTATYVRRILMQEHHVPTPEELAAQAAAEAKRAAEAEEQANYKPDPQIRTVLEDGRIAYDAMSKYLVPPGEAVGVDFGETTYDDKTGFPGMPETRIAMFGITENFKPEAVYISLGFTLRAFYGGNKSMLTISGEIPAEMLDVGKPQPDYDVVPKGLILTLAVRNVSGMQKAFRGRIVGKEMPKKVRLSEDEKQQVRDVLAHFDARVPHQHSFDGVDDRCVCGEVRPQS